MKRSLCAIAVLAVFGLLAAVSANQDLLTLQGDDNQWAMPGKNYAATRYSTLKQITTGNIKNLRQVWSFSTGALRGHEGQPLVVGSTMYVHSAYPNHVYAIDMTKEGWPIKWQYTPTQNDRAVAVACCDSVHRGVNYAQGRIYMTTLDGQVIAIDANTGKEVWKVRNADPTRGETMTMSGLVVKDKFVVGVSGGEFGIRGWVAAYNLADGKQAWKAVQHGSGRGPQAGARLQRGQSAFRPHRRGHEVVAGRALEKRRRQHVGLVRLRSRAQPALLLHRQPRHVESVGPPGRQQVVDVDHRQESRHRHGEVGVPDDAVGRVGLRRDQRAPAARPHRRRQAHQDPRPFRPERLRVSARPHERLADLGGEVCPGDQLGRAHRSEDRPPRRGAGQAHASRAWRRRTSARPQWAARISSRCRSRRTPN